MRLSTHAVHHVTNLLVYMKYTQKKNKNKKKQRRKGNQHGLGNLDQLATEIDGICRRNLPDGRISGGILEGHESEIRQNALIKVLGGFLSGNPDYARARKTNDPGAIMMVVERTVAIALRICKVRMTKQLTIQAIRHTQITEHNGGVCRHPSELQPTEWPQQIQHGVLLNGIARAVSLQKLSAKNARVVAMRIEEGLSVERISEILEVTPSAIYQQLDRVVTVLPAVLERLEPSFEC